MTYFCHPSLNLENGVFLNFKQIYFINFHFSVDVHFKILYQPQRSFDVLHSILSIAAIPAEMITTSSKIIPPKKYKID